MEQLLSSEFQPCCDGMTRIADHTSGIAMWELSWVGGAQWVDTTKRAICSATPWGPLRLSRAARAVRRNNNGVKRAVGCARSRAGMGAAAETRVHDPVINLQAAQSAQR